MADTVLGALPTLPALVLITPPLPMPPPGPFTDSERSRG